MIAKLKGKIDEIKPTELILDVNGVGYEIHIPLSTYEKIQGLEETSLYIYTHHKEDQLKLFGFFTINEKNIFKLLLNISGIGPAMGISILSGISIDLLIEAVRSQNPGMLIKVPGIGGWKIFNQPAKQVLGTRQVTGFQIEAPQQRVYPLLFWIECENFLVGGNGVLVFFVDLLDAAINNQ